MNANASFVEVDVRAGRGDDSRALRPADRDHRPLLGHARAVHLQVGPLGLEPFLEAIHHRRRAAGRGGDDVAVLGQAHRDAVVEDHPVEAEHQPVPDRADGQVRHPVRVHPIEEHAGVGPADVDLAERAGVEHADARAHRPAFARDGGVHVLAVPREVAGPLPLADVLVDGAVRVVPGVDRRHADRVEQDRTAVRCPASAENGTGVYGGRALVGPCAPGAHPSRRFTISAVRTPLVRPWSIVVPM